MAVSDGTYQRREIVSALAAEKKTATRQKHVQSKAMALACADARVLGTGYESTLRGGIHVQQYVRDEIVRT